VSRLAFLLVPVMCWGHMPLAAQPGACPEVEFGHPARTLEDLVFPVVVTEAPEAFRGVRQTHVSVFIRPFCAGQRGTFPELRFEPIAHVMSVRKAWLEEEGFQLTDYETAYVCAGTGGGLPPPPPAADPDDPRRARYDERERALNRLCRDQAWIGVSLPSRVEDHPERWVVDVRGWSPHAFDRVEVEFHWEGEGHEPELIEVRWVDGAIS